MAGRVNALVLGLLALAASALAAPVVPTASPTGTCVIQTNGALVVTPSWGASLCFDLYDANWVFLAQVSTTTGAGTFNVAQYLSAGGSGASYFVEGYSNKTCTTKSFIAYFGCVAALAPGATQPPPPTTPAPTTAKPTTPKPTTPKPTTPKPTTPKPTTAVPTTGVPSTCAVQTSGALLVTPSWTTSKCIDLYDANYVFLAQVVASAGGTALFNAASYITAGNQYWVEGYNTTNCKGKILSYFECTASPANYCATNPCLNGGACVNGASGYTCSCPAATPARRARR